MSIRVLFPWFDHKKKRQRSQIFEGTTKNLFQGETPGTYVLHFKDQIESKNFDVYSFPGRGAIANRFSEILMKRLEAIHISTHFIKNLNMREQLIKSIEMFPFRVVVHNQAVGDFATRLGIKEFSELERPVVELQMKLRHQKDRIITAMHLDALKWANQDEIDYFYFCAGRINDNLLGQFQSLGLDLLNFSLEFGRQYLFPSQEDPLILLADELSPENFLVQDMASKNILTIFQEDETGVTLNMENYLELAKRFGVIPSSAEESEIPKTPWISKFKERFTNGHVSQ